MAKKKSGRRTPLDKTKESQASGGNQDAADASGKTEGQSATSEDAEQGEPGSGSGIGIFPPTRWLGAHEQLRDLAFAPRGKDATGRGHARVRIKSGKIRGWKLVFLERLRESANVTLAARAVGRARSAVYEARERCGVFAAAWDDAMETGIDLVEAAAFKSAVYGDLEPVTNKEGICGWVVKYSDAMRALILKARRPQVYREKVEHSGTVQHITLGDLKKRLEEAEA